MSHSADRIRRATVITHGKPEKIGPALERLEVVARASGVALSLPEEELEKHGLEHVDRAFETPDIGIVLGGDGTMLRALQRFLGTSVPVIGVNFGTIGFLTAIRPERLEEDLRRVFAGDLRVVELPTLEAEAGGVRRTAVNDVVVTSATLGRMVELDWSVGGENLGRQRCDGVITATPVGSTGYNLSNGGPVMVWGLDAMAVTFIAPHSLDARPLVVPRSRDLTVVNATHGVAVSVLADGHEISRVDRGGRVDVRLGTERSRLATLPESTFFTRYRETFAT